MQQKKSHNLMGTFIVSMCALVWGFASVFQQQASTDVPFFTFNGLRFSLAVCFIAVKACLILSLRSATAAAWQRSTAEI